jgi:hypothetical protein
MPFKIRESAMMFTTGLTTPMQIIRWFEIVVKEYRLQNSTVTSFMELRVESY